MILFFWIDFHCFVDFDLYYFLNTLLLTHVGHFCIPKIDPNLYFMNSKCDQKTPPSFASIFQQDDFQIIRFTALVMTIRPTFKNGRQETHSKKECF